MLIGKTGGHPSLVGIVGWMNRERVAAMLLAVDVT